MTINLDAPVSRPRSTPAIDLLEGERLLCRLPGDGPDRPFELFTVTPVGRTLGAEITGVDLREAPGPELRAELHRALLEWKVLFFPGQDITGEQQRDFGALWGSLETNPMLDRGGSDEVVRFGAGAKTYENIWHADTTFREEPAMGAVLRMVQTPPFGGDTMWADMAAAYDNLSDEVKARIEGAEAVHDMVPGFARFLDADKLAGLQDEFPPVTHPVVRTHPETGRRTLFVNASFTTEIVGLPREESDALLRHLFAQAHVPEFQVRHRWSEGTVAFWDNRATQHYAVGDYHPHKRVAERVAIAGGRPF
ncbi:taurine dioxygenase [Pseudonocardia sp. EC080610-09]|uniref:TauD/TfdA dioxygenase family protein n=1 Tax=unclassified Pseudonocardia TaxID=2619320 RepID=UPI0007063698|nr:MULTISPECIES: TauD/TfdA family dioxygenase [unclassified Pseudonocardia]ALL77568.1 taurine dioxygenase [Pseudonocardia sp. EC080610-09]ALL80484.1 taurine dioxygenase [Pseudonocardia sp. EC080619-01]